MKRYEVYYEITMKDAMEVDAENPDEAREEAHRKLTMLHWEIIGVRAIDVWDCEQEKIVWKEGEGLTDA